MALGAHRSQVITQIVKQGLAPVVLGNIIGLLAVWYLQRFVAALLHGLSPLDPFILGSTVVILSAVGAAASCLPALRAARVQPVIALQHE